MEVLEEAYRLTKLNKGAPGLDGVTFVKIETEGVQTYLHTLQEELQTHSYKPGKTRKVKIPKAGGKSFRELSILSICDRVVQGAVKLILEPIFEADFKAGSYGYRPKRATSDAIKRVSESIVQKKTKVIDLDIAKFFDTVRKDILLKR
ncbi:reverse transcriptase domain-containing protein [Legionella jordanis]|uniref:RNA-directed DNA polymerase n=1 Tax=Legionella jordanis TaxID=456 RepID=A0A0W0V9R5_9GAMM|nr:reverse transcriptase domain-containing protein [Legionella jordanis]KTD16840.1 RNA-directed DNA polymerase [Legionella jordanis]VEH11691.1 RNA-directed DNA polymerase [Legionella jordanis]